MYTERSLIVGSLVVALTTMGCYLSKWCLTIEEDREEAHVTFGTVSEILVPCLKEIPKSQKDDMFWSAEDYAAIRENQRRLIEIVVKQVREYPDIVPPPIPGESRRGLGIICEPGTNSGRAARVRSARRIVVEAHRDKNYTPEMVATLAAELSQYATKNAYDVGIKDYEAISADFDLGSFKRRPVIATQGLASMIRNDSLNNLKDAAPQVDDDGLGLASMIRNDSLGNLAAAHQQRLTDLSAF